MPWKYSDPLLWEAAVSTEEFPISDISRCYLSWMKYDEYSVLENKNTHKLISMLQSKRGNKAYARKQKKRLEPINNAMADLDFDRAVAWDNRMLYRETKALFITLGSNSTAGVSLPDAWLNLKGHDSALNQFNAYMKRLFSRYHGIKCIKYATHARKEAYSNGYPHIHMIVILDDYVRVHNRLSKKADALGHKGRAWRIDDRDYNQIVKPLKEAWSRYHIPGSFVDVQGVVNNQIYEKESGRKYSVMGYLMKYVTKDVQIDNEKSVYTHAMLKFFGMRDIFSKSFQKMIGSYTEINNEDVRLDITLTEFKQRQKEAKKRIRQTRRRIIELEAYKHCFGFLTSAKHAELEQRIDELAHLEQYLIDLKEAFLKTHPEYSSEWRYIKSVTLDNPCDITSFFAWLEEYNTNPDAYNQDFISSIAHIPFNIDNLNKCQNYAAAVTS